MTLCRLGAEEGADDIGVGALLFGAGIAGGVAKRRRAGPVWVVSGGFLGGRLATVPAATTVRAIVISAGMLMTIVYAWC